MKIKYFFAAAILSFGLISVSAQTPQEIPGQFIVKLKDQGAVDLSENTARPAEGGEKAKHAQKAAKIKDVKSKGGVKDNAVMHDYTAAMVGFSAKLSPSEVQKLKSDPNVEGVFQDYVVTLGPIETGPKPSDVVAQSQYLPCGISKSGGPLDGSTKSTWIWILDTGIDPTHPDLNVQTSATYAKSFIAGETTADGNSHGTHCAGIAAAKNNTIGVVGVSAGAKVVPVKVLSNAGSGSFSGIIAGLNHVMTYKISGDVVSMSLGGYSYANCENYNTVLRDVIRNLGNAGVWVCIAAGNNGVCTGANFTLPGCINGTRVLTVGAIDCNNVCAGYSNWGKPAVDWAAVGSNVYSTIPGGGYGTKSGTSMATPTVAGVCHARNGLGPVSAGNVTCCGAVYPIARR